MQEKSQVETKVIGEGNTKQKREVRTNKNKTKRVSLLIKLFVITLTQ
jgi:hypothetical protein